ncbi:hypothetical protein BTM158_15010 [Helicobacter pylori]
MDWDKPIGIKDFFKGNDYLYRKFCSLLGKHKASVKDFISSKEFVSKYRYTPKQHTERAEKLQSYLESKRDFIGFVQTLNSLKDNPQDPFLPNEETSFLVFANEPTIIFNLRDYLLVLVQIFSQQAICYCESKCPMELINASPGKDFNKAQDSFSDIKFSTPNQLEQSLNALKNKLAAFFSKHPDKHNGMEFNEIAKTQIEALYMPQSSDDFDDFRKDLEDSIKSFIKAKQNRGFPKIFDIADIEQEEREVIKWREKERASKQSYKQNLQIKKIANDLKHNKVVDKRTILSVIDADLERGFIPPKDLLKQLEKISASLSKDIVIAIKQAEKLELNYALIDNIQHNTLDDTLDFTFIIGDSLSIQSLYVTFDLVIDIDRPMSEQFLNHIGELGNFKSSRKKALEWVRLTETKLIIKTPREVLKNVQLSQIEEILTGCIFNGAYRLQNDLKGNR